MYPILYVADETVFTTNGIGILRDCISCEITEERNGIYVCEFKYPVTGRFYSEINVDRIIKAKPNEKSNLQLFRIYRNTKPINGVVTYYCNHISYDLNRNPVAPFNFKNVTAETAMNNILTNCIYGSSRFSAWSNITNITTIKSEIPKSARACFGGSEGSVLQHLKGEFEFDNFTIKLHSQRGTNSGVRIAYGKNLTNVKVDTNIESVYTSIYPYVLQEDGYYKELPEKTIELNNANSFAEARTLILDLTSEFDSDQGVTDQQLRDKANSYATNNKINEIKQNIEISFVQLWQTKEYENVVALERVGLCDTVTVYYETLGIDVTTKVISTRYDSLKERYISMQLGNAKSNFQQSLLKTTNGQINTLKNAVKNLPSYMQNAIDHATQLITGGLGGYVVINTNSTTGYPEEILIMDSADKSTAVNVWRFNAGGLGHSHNGYNGPFNDVALTADGKINATMITTGILSANLIKAGILQDATGSTSLDMTNGKITINANNNNGSLEIWTNGVTLYHANNSVAASMFLSRNDNGVLTAERALIGTRDNEKINLFINDNDKGVVLSDITYAAEIDASNNVVINGIDLNKNSLNQLEVSVPISSQFVLNNNNIEVGSFYVTVAGKSLLNTDILKVDGNTYEPTTVNINGTNYTILAKV